MALHGSRRKKGTCICLDLSCPCECLVRTQGQALHKASESGGGFTGHPLLCVHAENAIPPVTPLGPHVAPLGITFYDVPRRQASADSAQQQLQGWPKEWGGDGAGADSIFVAEHGSWNRDKAIGYRIAFVKVRCPREWGC